MCRRRPNWIERAALILALPCLQRCGGWQNQNPPSRYGRTNERGSNDVIWMRQPGYDDKFARPVTESRNILRERCADTIVRQQVGRLRRWFSGKPIGLRRRTESSQGGRRDVGSQQRPARGVHCASAVGYPSIGGRSAARVVCARYSRLGAPRRRQGRPILRAHLGGERALSWHRWRPEATGSRFEVS